MGDVAGKSCHSAANTPDEQLDVVTVGPMDDRSRGRSSYRSFGFGKMIYMTKVQ